MKKNYFFLLFAILFIAGKSIAQQVVVPCGNTQMIKQYLQQYPQITDFQKQLENETQTYYLNHPNNKLGRTTADADTEYYDIPVVVHVNHNYGAELLPDNDIYNLIAQMNQFYSLQNDTSSVVPEFKQYVGKAYIRFHLATKDPNGNPTKGITHQLTYLTYGGDDQAKLDQWPPSNYVNIWFDNRIGAVPLIPNAVVVAYAEMPPVAAADPFVDGIISNYSFINDYATTQGATGGSIDHEMGHIFNLWHTFGQMNDPGPCPCPDPLTNYSGYCGDDDLVDDTPPTDGCLGCCNLFDTVCSQNYYKIYPRIIGAGDSLVNYPDTANEQNIMNYATCKVMFTKQQVARMRAALNSNVGHRDSLWTPNNLALTGALKNVDLAPVTDFSVKSASGVVNTLFTCPGISLRFTSACWNDTITNVSWTFNSASGPTIATSSISQTPLQVAAGTNATNVVTNSFSNGGWVSLTLSATGNNTGTTTTTYPRAAFVADATATPANEYYMEFNNADTAKWPMFNYYNNDFQWQIANVGFDDNSCIEYTGYDMRFDPNGGSVPTNGSPLGDYDDFFSMPMDFTDFGAGACNLNYYYSGASRSSLIANENDTLEIDYSVDKGVTWVPLSKLGTSSIDNMGATTIPYIPANITNWAPMSISIPLAARTVYTVFRFQYRPGVILGAKYDIADGSIYSSGNNFYMDRINFSAIPANVNKVMKENLDVAVVPNPTSGDAYVVIRDADYATAKIVVSDITGKAIYTISQQLTGKETSIEIPHSAISAKGIYMVQTVTGSQVNTQKLVVY